MSDRKTSKVTVVRDEGRARVLVRIERINDPDGRGAYETLDITEFEAETLAHAILLQLSA